MLTIGDLVIVFRDVRSDDSLISKCSSTSGVFDFVEIERTMYETTITTIVDLVIGSKYIRSRDETKYKSNSTTY